MPVTDQTPEVTLFDSNGVEMSVANGVAIPVGTRGLLFAGRDPGGVTRFVATDTSGNLTISPGTTYPSFTVVFDRIPPVAAKYMATLFNTSATRKVTVQRIYQFNWQTATNPNAVLDQEVRRITARTIGAPVTPIPDDSTVPLSAGITADTTSTGVTLGALLKRIITLQAEATNGIGSGGIANLRTMDSNALVYEHKPGMSGWTLRQNQGITIRNITNITTGTCSYVIDFTDEPA